MTRPLRVRFAPSPTGMLHIGSAHTALFNWLFAKKENGTFLLRIEDTDAERNKPEWVDAIFEAMEWLCLDWDEDIQFQSKRIPRYQQKARELLDAGKAYYCYYTPQELEERRQGAMKEGKNWRNDRKYANISDADKEALEAEGRRPVVRLAIPEGKTRFTDRILGDIEVNNTEVDDFVILRSDGSPLYHLAVVVDDIDAEISHVIRGLDHVSNTPKHVHLFEALGYEQPEFAHLPMILGQDKKKLSKRNGVVSVMEYRDAGYLPEAVINYLTLLGWQSGDDQEFFSIEELHQRFSIDQVHKRDTVFDVKKFQWLNGQHINARPTAELLPLVTTLLVKDGVLSEAEIEHKKDYVLQVINLLRERCRTLKDFPAQAGYFFSDDFEYNPKGLKKHWKNEPEQVVARLRWLRDGFAALEEFSAESLENVTRELSEAHGLNAALFIHPCRVALTGELGGPSLFHLIEILGKDTVLRRLDRSFELVETIETPVSQ